MKSLPDKLATKLKERADSNALRKLTAFEGKIDFSSNDYLGLARNAELYFGKEGTIAKGATGSRLLTGNHQAHESLEAFLSQSMGAEASLVFNSGYDANIGLISAVGLRGDLILYDSLAHASIRDGIQLSKAKAYKFRHNDLVHLAELLQTHSGSFDSCYVITESVFSMDGDSPDLVAMADICESYKAHFIVDEAHALGVFGERGMGLIDELNLVDKVFARVITFGKALGYHGAAVLGSKSLIQYLVNFSRSFIYTTALPANDMFQLRERLYWLFKSNESLQEIKNIHRNIAILQSCIVKYEIADYFIPSESAIHSCIVAGNSRVKHIAKELFDSDFAALPILAPTVPKGEERLRICLHSYNTATQIENLIKLLSGFLSE